MGTGLLGGGGDSVPVMAEILVEVEANVSREELIAAGEELRRRFGDVVFWPGMPAVETGPLRKKHNSGTGKIFMPAPGSAFARIAAKLRHPADGSGPGDLEIAGRVIEASRDLLGGGRVLYGASGMARPGCHDGYEALWWCGQAREKMEVVAMVAASGMSWQAKPPAQRISR